MADPSNIPGLWDKVDSGDKIVISAQVWNAILDAAVANRMGDNPSPDGAPGSRSATVIRIRNDSGAAVSRFGILGLNGPISTPTNNLTEFKRTIAFKGITPATGTHEGKFAVLLEPLAKDKIGAAVVSGIAPVQVTGSGDFAEITNSDTTKLTAGSTGSARILWAESGSGQRWAVIRIGEGGGGGTGSEAVRQTDGTNQQNDVEIFQFSKPVLHVSSGGTNIANIAFEYPINGSNANGENFNTNQMNVSLGNDGIANISIKTVPMTFLTNVSAVCNDNGTITFTLSNDSVNGINGP